MSSKVDSPPMGSDNKRDGAVAMKIEEEGPRFSRKVAKGSEVTIGDVLLESVAAVGVAQPREQQ